MVKTELLPRAEFDVQSSMFDVEEIYELSPSAWLEAQEMQYPVIGFLPTRILIDAVLVC
jgi:hypothetical protein